MALKCTLKMAEMANGGIIFYQDKKRKNAF